MADDQAGGAHTDPVGDAHAEGMSRVDELFAQAMALLDAGSAFGAHAAEDDT